MNRALLYCAGGGIGDSLVATVVAQALLAQYDSVDALTLPGHRSTLELVPEIERVFVDEGEPLDRQIAALRERAYAACVVTWATPRAAAAVRGAAIPVRVGQARRLYSRSFTHRVVVRSELGDVTSHWSDILLDYPRAIGCDAVGARPHLDPGAEGERAAHALRAELALERDGYFIVHPTNAAATERGLWPTEGWARCARALRERFSLPVLLSGAEADREIVAQVVAESGDTEVRSIAGRLSIGALAALSRDARAFVGITTGSMHVAAAVGARTVGIFPFQSDFPERWAPLCDRRAIVRSAFPCHAGDRKETCVDYACIGGLDTPRILAAVEGLLAPAPR
uniref:Uncharacterized protein n=1 Tax=mine drainage metagenome TaxID=410659 RepID=E6Q7D1_9ZZZZ